MWTRSARMKRSYSAPPIVTHQCLSRRIAVLQAMRLLPCACLRPTFVLAQKASSPRDVADGLECAARRMLGTTYREARVAAEHRGKTVLPGCGSVAVRLSSSLCRLKAPWWAV